MKNKKTWFSRHKLLTAIIILSLFVIPLLTVHFLFKWKSGIYILESEWSAGEIIGYIAGFEAFIGTVFLGLVAIYQNKKANDINDKLLHMQEELQRFQIKEKASPVTLTPCVTDKSRDYYLINDDDALVEFDVVNQKYKYMFFLTSKDIDPQKFKVYDMVIEIENISDNIIKEISINNFKVYDIITNNSRVSKRKEDISEYYYEENKNSNSFVCTLKPGDKIRICFKIGMDEYDLSNESFSIDFDLFIISIYNVLFFENVRILRNNVVDVVDRVYIQTDNSAFINFPEATEI